MKRTILSYLLTIILIVVIFSSCKCDLFFNDYDNLDTVKIFEGEKLYNSISEWTRFDSVTVDSVDTTLLAWFSILKFDTLLTGSFKGGGHKTFNMPLGYDHMEFVHFQCLEVNRLMNFVGTSPEYSATFIIESGITSEHFDKPNIYIYPTKKTRMTVSLDLPEGGNVTESIPAYPKKWKNIRVKPDGTINNKYDFLFYEADLPGDWQKEEGWCIAQKDLKFFFMMNLRDYGFNKKEITDFIEWWIPRLKDKAYYKIYPQHTAKINEIIPLKINKDVDSLLRLFYFIEGSDYNWHMKEPQIPAFKRDGFVVTEWGVSLI